MTESYDRGYFRRTLGARLFSAAFGSVFIRLLQSGEVAPPVAGGSVQALLASAALANVFYPGPYPFPSAGSDVSAPPAVTPDALE